jgi:hypothetical protein
MFGPLLKTSFVQMGFSSNSEQTAGQSLPGSLCRAVSAGQSSGSNFAVLSLEQPIKVHQLPK